MKKSVVFLQLLFTVPFIGEAQLKPESYRVRIEFFTGDIAKGFLIALHDSSIQVSKWSRPSVDTVFQIQDIKKLSLRRRNAPARGLGLGAAAGIALGSAVGYIAYEPPECDGGWCLDFGPELNAIGGAFVGVLGGGLIGLAGGSVFIDYDLDGNQTNYARLRNKLLLGPRSTLERKRIAAPNSD